jgi:hypothetical protein
MLLKHCTWQQFLIAALILSLIWYLVVVPLLCRDSLKYLWKRNRAVVSTEPLVREWDEELPDAPEAHEDDPMGKPKLPEGMSKGSMSMLRFAADAVDDEPRVRQLGLIPDALEELKSIFQILEKEQGSKQDFISLFGLVKAKYGAISGTPDEARLNRYIRENALFPISDDELDHLWN